MTAQPVARTGRDVSTIRTRASDPIIFVSNDGATTIKAHVDPSLANPILLNVHAGHHAILTLVMDEASAREIRKTLGLALAGIEIDRLEAVAVSAQTAAAASA